MSIAGLIFACAGCDYTMFSTQVGEHVVYHWDPTTWAMEDEQLCGGTVSAADQFVSGVSAHYGWTLPDQGPKIEYFWDRQLAISACSSFANQGCVAGEGKVFTYVPLQTHELAHTVKGGHGHGPFIQEGFASRWQAGLIDLGFFFHTNESINFFSEAELRAQLRLGPLRVNEIDYGRAFTWIVALENTYGPAKMGEFIDELSWLSSTDDVEHALQKVFGISLAESVVLASSLPEGVVDDPVCVFPDLPTFAWTENPFDSLGSIHVDRGEAHCADGDMISISGQRATWLFALDVPEPVSVEIHMSVPAGADSDDAWLGLAWCNGKVDPDWMAFNIFSVGTSEGILDGRSVGALIGAIRPDGTVDLPSVSFLESPQL